MISAEKFRNSTPVKLKIPSRDELSKKDVTEYNEVEKMVSALPYDATVPELANGRLFSQINCRKFNTCDPCNALEKENILRDLLGTYKNNVIEPPFHCDYGSNIHLGEGAYMNFNCTILDCAEVRIGKNTLFAPGVQVYTSGHPIDPIARRHNEFGKPVTIGNDCWIGGNAVICPGVTIGDGVTIGAGSVVTKDIEPYCVAVGAPARIIKRLPIPKEDN